MTPARSAASRFARRAADADDLAHRAGALQRERARAADQADADDDELADAHGATAQPARDALSAERRLERGEKALVLRRQADGDAQDSGRP